MWNLQESKFLKTLSKLKKLKNRTNLNKKNYVKNVLEIASD